MLIAGIPDADLERIHWRYGGGRGAVGYRHVPSGITAVRECLDLPVRHYCAEALTELERKLREQGLLPNQ
jgi:hypothetical protein